MRATRGYAIAARQTSFADTGSEVWGIVYDVSEPDLIILDDFEDGYRREKLFVCASGDSQRSVEVLVYIAEKEDTVPLPNPEYKRLIRRRGKALENP